MSKKNKVIFGIILLFTILVVGLCIYFVNKDLNKKNNTSNTGEVEVCTKSGC